MLNRTDRYKVVINHEEQYSLIPYDQPVSREWREAGKIGTSKECLTFIEEVWTDMRSDDKLQLLKIIGR